MTYSIIWAMSETVNVKQLLGLSVRDAMIDQIAVKKRFSIKPEEVARVYEQSSLINGFKTIVEMARFGNPEGRDGGVYQAGYFIDYVNLLKPEFKGTAFELVRELGDQIEKEGMIEKELKMKGYTWNGYLGMIFGRAGLSLWLGDQGMQKLDPRMSLDEMLSFHRGYFDVCTKRSEKDVIEYNGEYLWTWFEELLNSNLLDPKVTFEIFLNMYEDDSITSYIQHRIAGNARPSANRNTLLQ